MVRNGKFGKDLMGWSCSSGVDIADNQGVNGTKCARLSLDTLNSAYIRQMANIEAQSTYVVRCKMKWTNCSRLSISRYIGSGGWETTFFNLNPVTSGEYRNFEITYDLSSGSPNAIGLDLVFRVYRSGPAGQGAEAFIDNVEVIGPAPTRIGTFRIVAECNVLKADNHDDSLGKCPVGRRLYAYFVNGDMIKFIWPTRYKPWAHIILDNNKILGCVDPNFTWSDSDRILQVAFNEIGNSRIDYGNAMDPWCQTFVNWISLLGGAALDESI